MGLHLRQVLIGGNKMDDVRPGEYKQMMMIAKFLSDRYPQYFKLEDYEHPVDGFLLILA